MRNHTLVHDRTIETEVKENMTDKVVQRALVSVPKRDDVSDSDEEVENAIKICSQKTPSRQQSGQTQYIGGKHAEQGKHPQTAL